MTLRLSPRTALLTALAFAGIAALGWYLYDPPWIGQVTTGFSRWQDGQDGRRLRWTLGRATFYVPREATTMTLPVRAVFPGPSGGQVRVSIAVDDRPVAAQALDDPGAWVTTTILLPAPSTARSGMNCAGFRWDRWGGDKGIGDWRLSRRRFHPIAN